MHDPGFRQQLVAQQTRRLEQVSRHTHMLPQGGRRRAMAQDVELRLSTASDGAALARLSQLESRPLPAGNFVVAEVAGEVVAALPLTGGKAFGNPFRPTAYLEPLMRLRLRQLAKLRRGRRVPVSGWSLARG
jgi:hypothetical protein